MPRNPGPREDVCTVDVAPELAAHWLTSNLSNRNIREHRVVQYARDMASGDWRWTGESIKFDNAGNLIDGQHRLLAVVRSGVTVRFLIVHGLEPGAQENVDSGIGRTFNDVLRLRGERSPNNLAAVIRRIEEWDRGVRGMQIGRVSRTGASSAVLLRVLENHPELRDLATQAHRLAARANLTTPTIACLIYAFGKLDDDAAEDAEEFFGRVADGQNQREGDPIYELRRTLSNLMSDPRSRPTQAYLTAVTIKAWNAYREGRSADDRPVGLYRWRTGGAHPEPFPEPK